jgi:hypothetical protein
MAITAEGIKHRYGAVAMAHSDVDLCYLERRVHDLVTQSDRHLRAIGG